MIDHTTRMLAVDLQAAVSSMNAQGIQDAIDGIAVRLSGNPTPPGFNSNLQLVYLLAVVIQHIPAGVILKPPIAADSGFSPMYSEPQEPGA